ncbi:hypothetical protein [Anaeroarcus burkinensis]|uniref:hypothetical protein n=1 Tax=Anaeroarcus burkinensis TaxID=82376 RepID=UPI000486A150|nr:hypothetical protein [Anaeroarcus burkinensis]
MSFSGIADRIVINSTGLESCVEFDLGSEIGRVNCYMLLAKSHDPYCVTNKIDVYVEDSKAISLKIGDRIELKLSIVFGNGHSKVAFGSKENFVQPKVQSSHTKFTASIQKIIDEYTLICSVGKLGKDILAEFEEPIKDLMENETIEFNGEIKAELI